VGKSEVWVNQWGAQAFTEQNPCGCHPFDFIIEKEFGRKGGFSFSFKSRREFSTYMKRNGWEKL
jgi:hypothetical protein